MSEVRKVGRGALWSILNSGAAQFLALAVFFVTARFVSPADFGIMATCMLVLELFKQVGIESFATWIMAKARPAPGDYDACFTAILATSVASGLVCFAAAGPLAQALGHDDLGDTLRLLSMLLLTTGLSRTHEAWLSRQLSFGVLAIRSIVSIVIGGAVGIGMAVQGYGLASLIAQQLVTALVATVALWAVSRWSPRLHLRREPYPEMLRYARFVALSGLTNFASTQTDTLFASTFLGAAATGVYAAAKRILLGITLVLSTALNRVALPAFANLRGDPGAMRSAFLRAVSFTSTVTAPAFAGLAVVAPDLTALAMTGTWADVGAILSIIAVTAYLSTIVHYNYSVMLVHDRPHWQTALSALAAASNVVIFFAAVRYGVLGLALGFSLRVVLMFPLTVLGALRLLGISAAAYLSRILPSISASLVMAAAVNGLLSLSPEGGPILRIGIAVASGGSVYLAALLVLARRDLMDLVRFARKVA